MKIGEKLTMNVVRLETNEYGSRFILSYGDRDTYRVKAYDFQTENDYPSEIKVKIVNFEPFHGYPELIQDNEWVLNQTFVDSDLIGRNYEFEVIERIIDSNTNKPFLRLKDDFGIRFHRYYTDEDYNIGDRIRLNIKELKGGYLVLSKPETRTKILVGDSLVFSTKESNVVHVSSSSSNIRTKVEDNNFKYEAQESLNTEYKSSIVFDNDSAQVNVDKQLSKILKSIAGFLNAEGGTLYLGVNKNGSIRGIEGDYAHIKEGSVDFDEYHDQYFENVDGFENKIRNCVSQHLSSLASALFTFETEIHNGKTVAKICINKSEAPILYNGQIIFQRQGNSTRSLKNNELVYFCATKWFGTTKNTTPKSIVSIKDGHSKIDNDNNNDTRDYSILFTLNFHENGGWSRDSKGEGNPKLNKVIYSCPIEKFRINEKHRLLITYKSGNVNVVNLKGNKWDNKQGWSVNGYKKYQGLQSVFCANPMDMVAVFYELGGKSYVKVVDIDCITAHDGFDYEGNMIVPTGATDCKIFNIHHKYHDALRGLTRSARNYDGFDIDNNAKVRSSVQKLKEIIKDEYGAVFE